MVNQPSKFTQTTSKEQSKKSSFHINKGQIFKWILIVAVLVAIGTIAAVKTYEIGSQLSKAKNAIIFAYQNPELVDPVAEQYNAELESLKDSVIKRQVLQTATDSGKDLSQR